MKNGIMVYAMINILQLIHAYATEATLDTDDTKLGTFRVNFNYPKGVTFPALSPSQRGVIAHALSNDNEEKFELVMHKCYAEIRPI